MKYAGNNMPGRTMKSAAPNSGAHRQSMRNGAAERADKAGADKAQAVKRSIRGAAFPFAVLLGLFIFINMAGCASVSDSVKFEVPSQAVIYTDPNIVREPPLVYVHPASEVSGLKVLFVPFRVTQVMENAELTGYSVGKVFWQTWAAMRVFDYLEYAPDAGPFRLDTALRLARAKGADMLVSGYVTNFLSGSTVGQSSLAVQIEAYDTSSGLLVWSMAQAGVVPRPESNDYILFSTRARMPGDPVYALSSTLAKDMGSIMYQWSQRERVQQEEEEKKAKAEAEAEKPFTEKVGDFFKQLGE